MAQQETQSYSCPNHAKAGDMLSLYNGSQTWSRRVNNKYGKALDNIPVIRRTLQNVGWQLV